MKVAVVSNLLPPASSGQAMMLYRLLKDFDPADYCLISSQNLDIPEEEFSSRRLPGKYFKLTTKYEVAMSYRYAPLIVREAVNVSFGAYMRARQIAQIVRREGCEAVLSCSSGVDLLDVPSGFLASRLAGVSFYVYMFDTYSHMWLNPQTQFLGRRLEPFILKRADGIVVTNEAVRDLLRKRYGVDSLVIHNPCDISTYENLPVGSGEHNGEVRIVYTGAIYEAHYDAIRNLLRAIEMLGRPKVKLHLYTGFSHDVLTTKGIRGPVVFHNHKPASTIAGIQRRADVLFLPFAFKSAYPELIQVSSPSKIGEFLAARRPVLVHAPADSFVSKYFRKYDCGLVVDREDPNLLVEALARLLDEHDLAQRLASNAWQRAITDFDLHTAQSKFAKIMKLSLRDSK